METPKRQVEGDARTPDADGDIEQDGPTIEEQDWDALEGAPILPDSVPEDGDIGYDAEKDGELPEEDDDNPDQESDEALPDDEEEHEIRKDLSGQGVRYKPE